MHVKSRQKLTSQIQASKNLMMVISQLLYLLVLDHSNIVLTEVRHFLKQAVLLIYQQGIIIFQSSDLLAHVHLSKTLQLNLAA